MKLTEREYLEMVVNAASGIFCKGGLSWAEAVESAQELIKESVKAVRRWTEDESVDLVIFKADNATEDLLVGNGIERLVGDGIRRSVLAHQIRTGYGVQRQSAYRLIGQAIEENRIEEANGWIRVVREPVPHGTPERSSTNGGPTCGPIVPDPSQAGGFPEV